MKRAINSKNIFYWLLGLVFVIGIGLRTISLGYRDAFEDDECRLLSAILDKSWLAMFLPLGDAQSAPPFYILLLRNWGYLFGFGEKVLKILPYIFSLASLFLFYKVSVKILSKKLSILIATILFAINSKLIHFSTIIKQYSIDVMLALLCLLILPKIDITKLDGKKLSLLGICLIVSPMFSLPTAFFIAAFFLLNWTNNLKNRVFYIKLAQIFIPFISFLLIYYIFNLAPSKIDLDTFFPKYWDSGFIAFNLSNICSVIVTSFKYIFKPNSITLFGLILATLGIYLCAKEKNDHSKFLLISTIVVLMASYLKVYPFVGRVALYFCPVIILFLAKPLDLFNKNNLKSYILPCILIIAFCQYNINYFHNQLSEETYINYSPKLLMKELKTQAHPDDIILCNGASAASYLFYSSLYEFKSENVYKIPIYEENGERVTPKYLRELKPKQRYWFYIIKDFGIGPLYPTIFEFLKDENILYEKHHRNSHLVLIEKK